MFETGIGTAASIHFAISTRCISNASECFFPTFLSEDIIEGDIYSTMPESWTWELPKGDGLGISLKPSIDNLLA
jgi:L-alanine-DL-glutamate epimerase-like enolase superfamily enzyme